MGKLREIMGKLRKITGWKSWVKIMGKSAIKTLFFFSGYGIDYAEILAKPRFFHRLRQIMGKTSYIFILTLS